MAHVILLLVFVAIVAMQMYRGGWTFESSLPAYGLVVVTGLLCCFPMRAVHLPAKSRLPLISALVFFAYMVLRALFSPVEYITRPDVFILLGGGITYLATVFTGSSPRVRAWVVAAFLVLAFADGLIGAIQFFKGENFMIFGGFPRADYGKRASGFFSNPNQLAGFLEVAFLLGLGVALWGRWKLWARLLAGYGAFMCLAAMALTGSRGGYASTLAGALVFVVLSLLVKERKGSGKVLPVVVAALVLIAGLGGAAITLVKGSDVLRSRVEAAGNDLPFRQNLWSAAMKQFALSPIVGTGSATYLYYGRQFRDVTVQTDPIYSHNDYAQLLAEYGALGFLAFLFVLVTHARCGWISIGQLARHLRGSQLAGGSNSLALTIGALSAVAAYLVHSFVDFNLHIPANALLMAFVFGLLANPGSIPASSKTGEHEAVISLPAPVRFIAPALACWMLFAGIGYGYGAYYAHRTDRILSDWRFMDKPEIAREAEKLARLGLERDPRNLDLYRALGDALYALAMLSSHLPETRQKYIADSIETYKRAIELAPNDRNLILALAWTYDEIRQFSESAPLFKRALELDPNSAQVRSAYAAHLEAQGRVAEAKSEYEWARKYHSASAWAALERLDKESRTRRTAAERDAP